MENSKLEAYSRLVQDRKTCERCSDLLQNAASIDAGAFNRDRIGPYSNWQGNLRARIVVVAQDFADLRGFRTYRGWAGHNVCTNLNLVRLFASIDIRIEPPRFGAPDDTLFFTNAVLCIKPGAPEGSRRQQRIPARCFSNCSSFLRRTIQLVSPKAIISLGAQATRSVSAAFAASLPKRFSDTVGRPYQLSPSMLLVPVFHPNPTVVNTRRSLAEMKTDWSIIPSLLAAA